MGSSVARLAWLFWLVALLAVAVLAVRGQAGASTLDCGPGTPAGDASTCPAFVYVVGPPTATVTPDPYMATAVAGDGRTFRVERAWSYGDVVVAGGVLLLVALKLVELAVKYMRGAA